MSPIYPSRGPSYAGASDCYPNGDNPSLQHPARYQAEFSDEPNDCQTARARPCRRQTTSPAAEQRCPTQASPWTIVWTFDKMSRTITADAGTDGGSHGITRPPVA